MQASRGSELNMVGRYGAWDVSPLQSNLIMFSATAVILSAKEARRHPKSTAPSIALEMELSNVEREIVLPRMLSLAQPPLILMHLPPTSLSAVIPKLPLAVLLPLVELRMIP